MKRCNTCKKELDNESFHRDKSKIDGLYTTCKTCRKNNIKNISNNCEQCNKSFIKTHNHQKYCSVECFEIARDKYLKEKYVDNVKNIKGFKRIKSLYRYGITLKDYDELLQKQNGKCAICQQIEIKKNQHGLVSLAVDHDHKTGKVRGLLCSKCNCLLGYAKDSIINLKKAIDYLIKNGEY